MRPFQFSLKSFFIAFTFLFFLFSQMYFPAEQKSHAPPQHKNLAPSEKHFVTKTGSAPATMNDQTSKNSSRDIDIQKVQSKIMEARARILLAGQLVRIYRLKYLYAELLRIQKQKLQLEDDLKDQNVPENPLKRDIQALMDGKSPLTKNRGDKGLIYHS